MKIFLTGATGLIGRYLLESVPEGHEVLAISKTPHNDLVVPRGVRLEALPFENRAGLSDLLRSFRPDWVVHAGGEGNVDRVENDAALYKPVNLEFPLFLMKACQPLQARWLTFSSNGVYGGDSAPYAEEASSKPLNLYGRYKALIDAETRNYPGHWVILRPTISYGWNYSFGRPNPATFFLPRLLRGDRLQLVDDQFENPVYAGDVAMVLWQIIKDNFQGEINVGGGDVRISRYEWMRLLAEAFGVDPALVAPVKLADYSNSALRPRDTSFDTRKLFQQFDFRTLGVYEGAQRMKADIKRRPPL